MFYVVDRMFDGLQILSNTTKYDQTRSNSTKQGVQVVKCLVTKQCLMVFGRQTFIVSPGPNNESRGTRKSFTMFTTVKTITKVKLKHSDIFEI